jgi:hypothetical protein
LYAFLFTLRATCPVLFIFLHLITINIRRNTTSYEAHRCAVLSILLMFLVPESTYSPQHSVLKHSQYMFFSQGER